MKRAIIYGVTGQDGSYLSEFLLDKGYKVIGVTRRSSNSNVSRLPLSLNKKRFKLVQGDVTDPASIYRLLNKYQPQEVYNLAAQSHVGTSFEQPTTTWNITAQGCMNILEVIRGMSKQPRFYQASSSEMFGDNFDYDDNGCSYQDEITAFNPRSPYAIAKVAAHQATGLYRDAYGLFACSGILFNHESERRGEEFLTRKVTKYVADLHISFLEGNDVPKLKLGNLDARRDWGYAPDYVEAMWEMLQLDRPEDYVICTGQSHSVKEFVKQAFQCINIYEYQDYIETDKKLLRPSEVPFLRGDYSKAKYDLGWEPKITFEELVDKMVINDIQSRDRYYEDSASFEEVRNI
mgnify:FL=1